jgi:hypothetical protein
MDREPARSSVRGPALQAGGVEMTSGPFRRCRLACGGGLAALLIVLSTSQVSAWGIQAHLVIAEIFAPQLKPSALARMKGLLGAENLWNASAWADEIRMKRPETTRWHFVEIPLFRNQYDPEVDCKKTEAGDCAIAAIERALADLSKPLPRERQAEALKFLIHLVGDIHQPFHTADNGDRSGSLVRVIFNERLTTLHAVWDAELIAGKDATTFGRRLAERVRNGYVKVDTTPDVVKWTLETHALGRRAYGYPEFRPGAPPSQPIRLTPGYVLQATALVEQQLTVAGVRIAALLNRIFD